MMAKYTSAQLDNLCDEQLMKATRAGAKYKCDGCPGKADCDVEMLIVTGRKHA